MVQATDLRERKAINCGDCGSMLFPGDSDDRSYRCFHCDVIFCPRCARTHFGRSMKADATGTLLSNAEQETSRCNLEVRA